MHFRITWKMSFNNTLAGKYYTMFAKNKKKKKYENESMNSETSIHNLILPIFCWHPFNL